MLGDELLEDYAGRFVGRRLDVLAEEPERESRGRGHTPHFLEALWNTESWGLVPNEIVHIQVRSAAGGRLEGVKL